MPLPDHRPGGAHGYSTPQRHRPSLTFLALETAFSASDTLFADRWALALAFDTAGDEKDR